MASPILQSLHAPPLAAREPRPPLTVPVVTHPPLPGCWSVNLSAAGLGLVAAPLAGAEGPQEGEEVEVELALPGHAGGRLRARGEVRWRRDVAVPGRALRATLGVRFHELGSEDRVLLARFLREARPRVAVALASAEQAMQAREALGGEVELLFAASAGEVEWLLGRGDVAALLVCGASATQALALVDAVGARMHPRASVGLPVDVGPRVLLAVPAPAEALVERLNTGFLARALSSLVDPGAVREGVLEACREHGVRLVQQRLAREQERQARRERSRLRGPELPGTPGVHSPAMRRLLELVATVAPSRVPVLLQGETGTGKERLARTLHALGDRSTAPFVAQDCGAFAGAVTDEPGLFALADGGTLFLDQVERAPPAFQLELLRLLERGEVRPPGGTRARRVDVRIIAASRRRLEGEVRAARFRADLLYSLNTFTLDVPPLRERREDVLPLALHFLERANAVLGRPAAGVGRDAQELLEAYGWPGNVRELRNVVERAVLLSRPGELLHRGLLPAALVAGARSGPLTATPVEELDAGAAVLPGGEGTPLRERLAAMERELIRRALEESGGVLRRAADALGMDAVTFGRRVRKYGLGP